MDTGNFLKQIRTIIREEIEYAMDKKLTEMIKVAKISAKQLQESEKTSLKIKPIVDVKQTRSNGSSLNKQKKPSPISKFSKNDSKLEETTLQNILAETRRSMEAAMSDGHGLDLGTGDEYQELRYNSLDVPRITSKYVADMDGEYDPSIPIQPAVQKALTRDYSALVAAMNNKK